VYVEGRVGGSGVLSSPTIFGDQIDASFEKQKVVFENRLADASSLFRSEFNPNSISVAVSGIEDVSGVGKVFLTAGSICGALIVLVIGLLLVKYRHTEDRSVDPQLDLLSWSTASAGSRSRKGVKDDGEEIVFMDSPTGSEPSGPEIYGDYLLDLKPLGIVPLSPIAESTSMNTSESVETPRHRVCWPSGGERKKRLQGVNNVDENNQSDGGSSALEFERTLGLYSEGSATVDESSASHISRVGSSEENRQNQQIRRSDTTSNELTNVIVPFTPNTGGILYDLGFMENEWEGQLDSKVDAVSETPRQNNLEKFNKGINFCD